MTENAARQTGLAPVEQQALEHVWIHSARWLDLAERDGLRVMVRGEGCQLFDAHGLRVRRNWLGFMVYALGYGVILQPASVVGYASELLGLLSPQTKKWSGPKTGEVRGSVALPGTPPDFIAAW